LSLQTQDR